MNQKNKKIASVGAGPVPAQEKGITLIALVVTIIVLLILAGVTINMVLGNDGIIGQAQLAKQKQAEAEQNEISDLRIMENSINKYRQPGAYDSNGKLKATWSGIEENVIESSPSKKLEYLEQNGITSIIIPDSVNSIGEYAFLDCIGLTNITIPDSVTSIGDNAFSGCTGLTNITIPNSVTSIGDNAFSGCTGLTNITIPDSVNSIGTSAFSGCTGLTNITIPDSVNSIGINVFGGCIGLTSITIPDSVETILPSAFSGCTGLTNITIPDSVETILPGAFSGCSNLVIYYEGTEGEWNTVAYSNYEDDIKEVKCEQQLQ